MLCIFPFSCIFLCSFVSSKCLFPLPCHLILSASYLSILRIQTSLFRELSCLFPTGCCHKMSQDSIIMKKDCWIDPVWELLAYSYPSWLLGYGLWDCFCSALSWHFDRRLALLPVTGRVCVVVINSWSLDISRCMLQISHYSGACHGAETADPNALSLWYLALLPPIISIRKRR